MYDYNFMKNQAGVGIVVIEDYRRNGYAKQALEQLIFILGIKFLLKNYMH